MSAREETVRHAVEEAVRLGLTAFAPEVLTQLSDLDEREARLGLFDYQLAHPGELTYYTYAVCPTCQGHGYSANGPRTQVGDLAECPKGHAFNVGDDDLKFMYEPIGELAVPVEKWVTVEATPRSRPSVLAERLAAI